MFTEPKVWIVHNIPYNRFIVCDYKVKDVLGHNISSGVVSSLQDLGLTSITITMSALHFILLNSSSLILFFSVSAFAYITPRWYNHSFVGPGAATGVMTCTGIEYCLSEAGLIWPVPCVRFSSCLFAKACDGTVILDAISPCLSAAACVSCTCGIPYLLVSAGEYIVPFIGLSSCFSVAVFIDVHCLTATRLRYL